MQIRNVLFRFGRGEVLHEHAAAILALAVVRLLELDGLVDVGVSVMATVVDHHIFIRKLQIAHHFLLRIHHIIDEFLDFFFVVLEELLRSPLALMQFEQILLRYVEIQLVLI